MGGGGGHPRPLWLCSTTYWRSLPLKRSRGQATEENGAIFCRELRIFKQKPIFLTLLGDVAMTLVLYPCKRVLPLLPAGSPHDVGLGIPGTPSPVPTPAATGKSFKTNSPWQTETTAASASASSTAVGELGAPSTKRRTKSNVYVAPSEVDTWSTIGSTKGVGFRFWSWGPTAIREIRGDGTRAWGPHVDAMGSDRLWMCALKIKTKLRLLRTPVCSLPNNVLERGTGDKGLSDESKWVYWSRGESQIRYRLMLPTG